MTDYLAMAREAFSTSTTYFDSSIRGSIEAALRQFQGVHPAGSKYHSETYKARSRLFRPKTRSTIRKNEAMAAEAMFSTSDVVTITAEDDSNPAQEASAEVMQALMNYRLQKSIPWFLLAIGAYQDAQTVGVCLSHQYWTYSEKKKLDKPCVELLPVENIRIDPGSNWADPINSSPYVIRMIPMFVKDVKARMSNPDAKTGEPKWIKVEDAQILTATNGYSDTTRMTRERGRTDSKEQQTAIRDFAIVWVHQNIVEVDGVDMLYYTLGTLALLSKPVPLKDVYFHGVRPFVMGFCVLETHKVYPDGIAGITKDTQIEINEVANQRVDNVKFAMNKRYFVKRSAQVDLRSLTRNVPGSATLMNSLDDVKVQETNDVTSSAYQEQDRLNNDFDDVAGAFSQSSVQSNRKLNETVGGMAMLGASANQVGGYQLRTFVETWVEPVLRQLVLLEQYYETDVVLLAKAGRQANLVQRFGMDQVTDELLMQELTLRVNVGTGAANPQQQLDNFMKGMQNLRLLLQGGDLERFGLDVEEVIKEIFGKLGYKDGGRFFKTQDQDPRLTAAQNTISQLQQQLAQKVSPEMVAKQIEKLDAEIVALGSKSHDTLAAAVKKNMETFFASMQAAEVVAAIPAVAPIADAMVKEAGFKSVPGTDPDFQQPAAASPEIALNTIKERQTGTEFQPGQPGAAAAVPGDTTPNTPALPQAPASPFVGENAGIETARSDS